MSVKIDKSGGNVSITGSSISLDGKVTIPDSATTAPLSLTPRSTAPSSPVTGDIYLDDGSNTSSGVPGWRRYSGAAWEDVSAASGSGGSGGVLAALSDWGYLDTTGPEGSAGPDLVYQFDADVTAYTERVSGVHTLVKDDGQGAIGPLTYFGTTKGTTEGVSTNNLTDALRPTGAVTVEMVLSVGTLDGYLFAISDSGESLATNFLLTLSTDAAGRLTTFIEYVSSANEYINYDYTLMPGGPLYLALTRDSAGTEYNLYINGVLVDTQVASNAPEKAASDNEQQLAILGEYTGSANLGTRMSGCVSSFRMTVDEEFTAAQIADVWNTIKPLADSLSTLSLQKIVTAPEVSDSEVIGTLYTRERDVGLELHYLDAAGNEVQLTNAGSLKATATDLADWSYLGSHNPTGAGTPLAVYQFDGSGSQLIDRSGNQEALTVAGTVTTVTNEYLSQFNRTLSFSSNSGDTRLELTNTPEDLRIVGAVTLEWVGRFKAFGTGISFISCGTDGESLSTNTLYSMRVVADTGQLGVWNEYGAGGDNIDLSFDAYLSLNVPQHVVVTRASDGVTYKAYINGELKDTVVALNAAEKDSSGNTQILKVLSEGTDAVCSSFRVTAKEFTSNQVRQSYESVRPFYTERGVNSYKDWSYLDTVGPTGSPGPDLVYQFDGTADELNERVSGTHSLSGATAGAAIPFTIFGGAYASRNALYTTTLTDTERVTGAVTLEAVVCCRSFVSDDHLFSIAGDGESTAANFLISLRTVGTDGQLGVLIEHGSGTNEEDAFDAYLPADIPVYVVLTRDSTGKIYNLYINGAHKGELTFTNSAEKDVSGNTQELALLGYYDGGSTSGNPEGKISSFRMTTGEDFTAEQVAEVWSAIKPVYSVYASNVVALQEVLTPEAADNNGKLYAKDVGNTSELFYLDSAGRETQITNIGSLAGDESLHDWSYLDSVGPTGSAGPNLLYQFDGSTAEGDERISGVHDLTLGVNNGSGPLTFFGEVYASSSQWHTTTFTDVERTVGAVTVELVVTINSYASNDYLFAISNSGDAQVANFVLSLKTDSLGNLGYLVERGGGTNIESWFSNYTVQVGTPLYIALTRSADGLTYKLYVNGVHRDTITETDAAEIAESGNTQELGLLCFWEGSVAGTMDARLSSFRMTIGEIFTQNQITETWNKVKYSAKKTESGRLRRVDNGLWEVPQSNVEYESPKKYLGVTARCMKYSIASPTTESDTAFPTQPSSISNILSVEGSYLSPFGYYLVGTEAGSYFVAAQFDTTTGDLEYYCTSGCSELEVMVHYLP